MNRNNKWIFSRHTRDVDTLIYLAKYLQTNTGIIENEERIKLINHLKEKGIYNERFEKLNLSTLMNKISDLNFYLFGYKEEVDGQLKFLFSPLANLLLKYESDSEKKQKIFLTMLWGIQFAHPHNKTNERFSIYPFRLIFKLLLEDKLDNKLYVDEMAYFVMFIEKMRNEDDYNILINNILNFRKLNDSEISSIFINDKTTNLVNAVYEWDYYVKNILSYFNIIDSFKGKLITKLKQGKSTTRHLNKSYIQINANLINYVSKLNIANSLYESPIDLKSEIYLIKDIKKEIYNFCPNALLEEINEQSEVYSILKLPKLINEFAENPNGAGYDKFEDILEKSFNLFYNVEATKRSGAGNTDIECLYLDLNKKFAVEAKSTKNKLTLINSGRLKEHLRSVGGKYTIVITSRYVPAVLNDIKGTNVVILLANTFSEFLYNNLINNNREIDFELFDNIIETKLGTDISEEISELTLQTFANI